MAIVGGITGYWCPFGKADDLRPAGGGHLGEVMIATGRGHIGFLIAGQEFAQTVADAAHKFGKSAALFHVRLGTDVLDIRGGRHGAGQIEIIGVVVFGVHFIFFLKLRRIGRRSSHTMFVP
jgi:hypothetical protein